MLTSKAQRGKKLSLKKAAFTLLKLGIPAALFVYLLSQVEPDDYREFWEQPKRWHLLLAGQLTAFTAILITFFRWRILVRAFEIPFTVQETLRLGFLGYLLNFVSFGSVGGDLFKAVLVAKDKTTKRPEAVASVLLDRAVGLLGLVTLAYFTLTFLAVGELSPLLVGIRNGAGFVALGSVVALLIAVYAGNWFELLLRQVSRIPVAGEPLVRMAQAVRLLRKRPHVIVIVVFASVCVHFLLATTVYFVSAGVYQTHPTWQEHMMIVPPAMAAGALPLAPGGLGYQEGALAGLFHQLPNLPDNFSGILVATIYRIITLSIAGIGLIYYWSSHGREFTFAKEEAQRR